MERVETNFNKVIGEGLIGKAYAGKAKIGGKLKPVVVKYIHEKHTPWEKDSIDPVIVDLKARKVQIRKSHYDKAINALHLLRGKYSRIKVARQEFRLGAYGQPVLVSESFLKNGQTREVSFGKEFESNLFRRSKSTHDLIKFGIELLKQGVPLHSDAFSIVDGKKPFVIARDPDTLAHGIAKLEADDSTEPVDWTCNFFNRINTMHSYGGFSPKRQKELIEAALEARPIITDKEKLLIATRRVKLLKKIIHEVIKADIPHKKFKNWLVFKLENNLIKLKKISKRIKNPMLYYEI